MLSFMFAVLGSVIFWIVYFAISFVGGSITMKHVAPYTFDYFVKGKQHPDVWQHFTPWIIFLGCYTIWPIILIAIIIKFVFGTLFFPGLRKCIGSVANIIPEFEIKKKEETK